MVIMTEVTFLFEHKIVRIWTSI